MRSPRRVLRPVIAIALIGAAAGACTVGPSQRPPLATSGAPVPGGATASSSVPSGPGGPGRTADPIRWEPCDDIDPVDPATGLAFSLDCGTVVLQRQTDDPFRQQVLHVARARAPQVSVDAPNLVVLQDEPGENGRERVASIAAGLSPDLWSSVAVVVVDLAGTGDSVPVDCLSATDAATIATLGTDPREPDAADALAALSRSVTFACGDLAGAALTTFNSTNAADDLDTLRAALGSPTLDVLGRGFGATLAAVYADRYPGRVGHAVLDAPADPLEAADVHATAVAAATERALDRFAAQCPTFAGGCPLGSDPRAEIQRIVTTLDDGRLTGPGEGRTNGGTVLLTLLLQLGFPDAWPELAGAMAAAGAGDTTGVRDLLDEALGVGPNGVGWLGGSLLYRCNDSAVRLTGDQLSTAAAAAAEQAPLFGPYLIGLVGVCQSWPAPDEALGAVTATGAPPLLVIGAADDPLAPYDSVQALSTQLGSATLVTWQSGRHGGYPASPCVAQLVNTYFAGGGVPAVGTLCPP